jgi:hypothetical protein
MDYERESTPTQKAFVCIFLLHLFWRFKVSGGRFSPPAPERFIKFFLQKSFPKFPEL